MEMMNNVPKISIIVPVYNVEPYLRECVDSVLAQTVQDYELILVNDGSPDNCGAICNEYAEKDSRIRVIHKKNGGLSDARNAGLEQACGKYVFFLDSDDLISPDLLEKTIPAMEENMDMVVFKLQNFYPDGHTEPGNSLMASDYVMDTEGERMAFIQQILLPCKIGWSACTRIFRRDIIQQHHLRFEDNRKIFAEDMYFSLCYCSHISRIRCLEECLYHYRQRSDSIMGVQIKNSNIDRINELGKAVFDHYRSSNDCSQFVRQFDWIHYQIVVGQFLYQLWASQTDPVAFQKITRESVKDWDFLEKHVRAAMDSREMPQIGSASHDMELRSHAQYLLEGNWTNLRIQCKLIRMFRPMIDWLGEKHNRPWKNVREERISNA